MSSLVFLYLFPHDDFFKFAKAIEKHEKKAENKLEKRFLRYGKITTIFAIALFGGPILAALAIRFLLPKYKHKYKLIVVAMIFSSVIVWFAAKGTISIFV